MTPLDLAKVEQLIEYVLGKAWLCCSLEGGESYVMGQPDLENQEIFEESVNVLSDMSAEFQEQIQSGLEPKEAFHAVAKVFFAGDRERLELAEEVIGQEFVEEDPTSFAGLLSVLASLDFSQVTRKPYTVVVALDPQEVENRVDELLAEGVKYPIEVPYPDSWNSDQLKAELHLRLKDLRGRILLSAKYLK